MLIVAKVKQAGKKRALVEKEYNIPQAIPDLSCLITAIVNIEVEQYNNKAIDSGIVSILINSEIEQAAGFGKVGFGRRFGEKNADNAKAVEDAKLAFKDGLFRVFIDEEEITDLNSELNLKDGSVIVFIRLTFLAGRMW